MPPPSLPPALPPGTTVSLTLSGIPAELYFRLLADAAEAGRGLRAEVLRRLWEAPGVECRAPGVRVDAFAGLSRPGAVRS